MCNCLVSQTISNQQTIFRVMTSAEDLHLVENHDNLADRHEAPVARDILDTILEILFDIKLTNALITYIGLPKNTDIAKCSLIPPMWIVPTANEVEHDNVNTVHVHKALKSLQVNIDEHHDTSKQEAPLQE